MLVQCIGDLPSDALLVLQSTSMDVDQPSKFRYSHDAFDGVGAFIDILREEGDLTVVFPDVTRKPWALRLTEEFKSGACHAGQYEGSMVMAEKPDWVREKIRKSLPPNPASLSTAIREGRETFQEAGGPEAYFGYPAQASAEEGRKTIETLGEILAEAVARETGD